MTVFIFAHRINAINELKNIPTHWGVEIDVRGYGDRILLSHDPIDDPDSCADLEEYLAEYKHSGIIFNMKEAGYEQRVIDLARNHGIKNYTLLDVEFPYMYAATRAQGVREIALRYSEAEPIEMLRAQSKGNMPLTDWALIDTNTRLPLDDEPTRKTLAAFKTILVCPERWGRPGDIPAYAARIKELNFPLYAVMTKSQSGEQWEELLA